METVPSLQCPRCMYTPDGDIVELCDSHLMQLEALRKNASSPGLDLDLCTEGCLYRWDGASFELAKRCERHGGMPESIDAMLRMKRLKQWDATDVEQALIQLAMDVEMEEAGAPNRAGSNVKLKALSKLADMKMKAGMNEEISETLQQILGRKD